jgi:tetratricopeptide (TPR) repeat protein
MNPVETLARHLLEQPGPESERAFRAALSEMMDRQALWELAAGFPADPEVAIPTLERLLSLYPEDVEALVELGAVLWLMGEDEEAMRPLVRARALAPEHIQVLMLEAALTQEPSRRIQLYRRILEKEPSHELAQGQLQNLLLEEPARRLLETRHPTAQQDFLTALSQQTRCAPLWTLVHRFRYDTEVSLPALERILELCPEDIDARSELGLLLADAGERESATHHLEKARALEPAHPSVLMLEAALTLEPAARIALYRRVLALKPGHGDALRCLHQLGEEP